MNLPVGSRKGRLFLTPAGNRSICWPFAVHHRQDSASVFCLATWLPGTIVSAQASYTSDGHSDQEFEALVEQHYGPLYRFALSLTRTETDACDLTQETFRVWATKGHQLQDRTRAKSWLYTTLHRLFLESRRRHVRFPHLELDEAAGEIPNVAPDVVNRLDGQKIVDLLGQVDAQFRAPVALFYLEDTSYNEIAEILEIPLGTVKSRIARGLTQLKHLLVKDTANVADNPEAIP